MGRSTGCACSRTASVSTGADEGRGLLDHDAKATYRPSIETSAEKLSALPTFSFELTLTSSVVPFSRSRTITSKTPFSSPGTTSGPSVAPAGYHRLRALRQPGTWTGVPGASSPRVHRAGFQALPGAGRGRERIGRLIRSQAASLNPPRTNKRCVRGSPRPSDTTDRRESDPRPGRFRRDVSRSAAGQCGTAEDADSSSKPDRGSDRGACL
jgi:hypothetical protein